MDVKKKIADQSAEKAKKAHKKALDKIKIAKEKSEKAVKEN